MNYIQGAIPLKEIAAVTKHTQVQVEAEAAALGMFVGVNWAGSPAVSESDAEQLVSGEARRVQADAAEWRAHLDACESWVAARDELVRSAQAAAEVEAQRAGRGGGSAAQAGLETGRSVGAAFESDNPPPLWRGALCGNAQLLYSDGKRGLLHRAGSALLGVR